MEIRQARRPTWAEVDLRALEHNYRVLRDNVGPGVELFGVVKADAYGHGGAEVAKTLVAAGAEGLAVAIVEEGVSLRSSGIQNVPVLILGGFFADQEELVLEHRLTPSVYRLNSLNSLSHAAERQGTVAPYHLKIDTGMGRLGLTADEVAPFLSEARKLSGVSLAGVFTHLSSAEEEDDAYTKSQITTFEKALAEVEALGLSPGLRHAANSAGALFHREARFDMVRAGLALYGINPNKNKAGLPLVPVLTFKTTITFLKRVPAESALGYSRTFTTREESAIATIPVGYGDGLNRMLSNKGKVIVRGHFAPMVGNISMDTTLIDVSDIPEARIGDEVILVGKQGELAIGMEDIAQLTHTIPYECLCQIGPRVPRVHLPASE